jgi:hypothetical protein
MVCDFLSLFCFWLNILLVYIFIKLEGFEKQVFQCFKVLFLVVKVEERDLLVKNAKVVTMRERKSKAREFAVKGGRIIAVFKRNEEGERLEGEALEVLDMGELNLL